jgi:hypothetical protein
MKNSYGTSVGYQRSPPLTRKSEQEKSSKTAWHVQAKKERLAKPSIDDVLS